MLRPSLPIHCRVERGPFTLREELQHRTLQKAATDDPRPPFNPCIQELFELLSDGRKWKKIRPKPWDAEVQFIAALKAE
jgi:hypothetical protein